MARLTRTVAAALSLFLVAACCPPAVADVPGTAARSEYVSETRGALSDRFETAWSLVAERYWDLARLPVDWNEVGERYRARLADVADADGLYRLLEEMYDEIGDDHSVFVPPTRVAEIRDAYGNMPCVAVFGVSAGYSPAGASAVTASLTVSPLHVVLGVTAAQGVPADAAVIGNVEFAMTSAESEAGVPLGYIKLPDLASEGVAGAVRQAVDRLQADGARGIVLDLRGNPGGRLVTMMQVAGVFTGGFLWRAVMSWTLPLPYPAIGQPATDLPMAVLIDGGVNSAAEGLAGALQAKGRATLFGSTTAGNVEAVLPFCLRDGSQAWIATGVLAPLVGATWEGRGVEPDVAIDSPQPAPGGSDPVLAAALTSLAGGSRP
jgi:carboxyl-terminal processing protease